MDTAIVCLAAALAAPAPAAARGTDERIRASRT